MDRVGDSDHVDHVPNWYVCAVCCLPVHSAGNCEACTAFNQRSDVGGVYLIALRMSNVCFGERDAHGTGCKENKNT